MKLCIDCKHYLNNRCEHPLNIKITINPVNGLTDKNYKWEFAKIRRGDYGFVMNYLDGCGPKGKKWEPK